MCQSLTRLSCWHSGYLQQHCPEKIYEKTNNAYPLHRLGEGAVYTAGTCCANNFPSLLYSLKPPAILIFGFGILYARMYIGGAGSCRLQSSPLLVLLLEF